MIYILLGALVLLVLVTAGRRGRVVRIRREWRFLSGAGAVAALIAAALLAVREAWIPAVALLAIGVSLMGSARFNPRRRPAALTKEPMSATEARATLGVGADATTDEIQAAYSRLMRMAHPDKGGTSGLAAQLNAARDRLLKP
ncbi:MAG: DnaJ-like protein [Phenylobacterium sp.]|jgi:uncharacterized membrane protein|nr:DnaJ-like protein [Phenylobacterium sp.]